MHFHLHVSPAWAIRAGWQETVFGEDANLAKSDTLC